MPPIIVDAEEWVESLFEALKDYVKANDVKDLYDIQFSFPVEELSIAQPPQKTIIHFEIDDHDNPRMGFGRNIVDQIYDDTAGTLTEHEAQMHTLNFDVGIWASQKSGGVNARLRAFQLLNDIFCGANAFEVARANHGFEIRSFTGGSFIRDSIGDIPLWRVAAMTLIVHVFAKKVSIPVPFITEIEQQPGIKIKDTVNIPIIG